MYSALTTDGRTFEPTLERPSPEERHVSVPHSDKWKHFGSSEVFLGFLETSLKSS